MRATQRAAVLLALATLPGCMRVLEASVGAKTIEPSALRTTVPDALLVDVRQRAAFETGHIPGAVRVEFGDLNGALFHARAQGDRPVVFVCAHGANAALATPSATLHGFTRVYVLAGGMDRWTALGLETETGPGAADVGSTAPPAQALTPFQQLLTAATGGFLKPLYMLLTLVLLVRFRGGKSFALRLLWHGMLWFLVGEVFCAANLLHHVPGRAYPSDVLHGVGMVAMSALVPWGLFRLLDEHVLGFVDPSQGCRFQRLCGRCWKRDPVRCGLHDLMLLLIPALAVLSLMPFTSDLRPIMVVASLGDTPVDLGVPIVNHLFELRLYPALAALGFLVALPLLVGGPRSIQRAEPIFWTAFGFMAYSLLRHLLVNAYRDEFHWSNFWEELTELVLVLAVGLFLVLFRRQLGLSRKAPAGHLAPGPASALP